MPQTIGLSPLSSLQRRPLLTGSHDSSLASRPLSGKSDYRQSFRPLRASSSGEPDASQAPLSLEEARRILGIPEGATFEQTVQAKNRLLSKAGKDGEKQTQIEVAYDALLMRSMKARLSGELRPSRDVQYADVRKYRPAAPREKTWQEKVAEKLPGRPEIQQSSQFGPAPNLVFGTLAASALLQELYLSPQGSSNVPTLQLGLAFGASVYYLRELKRLPLVRAGLLTTAGLLVGTLFGSALQSWLRIDIVPIGALHSPAVLVGELSIIGMWLTAYFLA